MWIQGYKLKPNETPNQYICWIIHAHARELAAKLGCEFKASVHSEACYLTINDIIVSIRNHPGLYYDVAINLSDFENWKECERYVLKYFRIKHN